MCVVWQSAATDRAKQPAAASEEKIMKQRKSRKFFFQFFFVKWTPKGSQIKHSQLHASLITDFFCFILLNSPEERRFRQYTSLGGDFSSGSPEYINFPSFAPLYFFFRRLRRKTKCTNTTSHPKPSPRWDSINYRNERKKKEAASGEQHKALQNTAFWPRIGGEKKKRSEVFENN